MIVPLEKPGTPTELVHFGVKGMKWGVRRTRETSSAPKTGMSTKKKVAIGVGVAALVVGSAVVAYKLKQSGNLPVSPLKNRHPMDVKKLLEANGNVKLSGREWKRYSRMAAANRAQTSRMTTARILAERNAARALKPAEYVRDASGNYQPRVFRRG